MKKIISALLVLCMLLSLAACASGGGNSDKDSKDNSEDTVQDTASTDSNAGDGEVLKAAWCCNWLTAEVFVTVMDKMKELDAADDSVEFEFFDANMDVATQIRQVEDCVNMGYDVLIVSNVEPAGMEATLTSLKEQGIPLICCSVQPSENVPHIFVGSNDYETGYVQAKYVADNLKEGGKILHIQGTQSGATAISRANGVRAGLEEAGRIDDLLVEMECDMSTAEGMSVMEDLLQVYDEFDAVICCNDRAALGAVQALVAANRIDGVMVVGIDAEAEACNLIKAGQMTMSVAQDFKDMAVGCYETIKLIQGGTDPETIEDYSSNLQIVTAENVDEYTASQAA